MRRAGQALGQRERADELVAQTEAALAEVRERTPAFEGKTVNIFNADPAGLYTINNPDDFSLRLLAQLGLKLDPQIAKLPGDDRAQISEERYDVLDCDLLIGTSVDPTTLAALDDNKLFKRLDVVERGGWVPVSIGDGTSLAFPSVLSIRFALDEVIPRLEQAITRTAS